MPSLSSVSPEHTRGLARGVRPTATCSRDGGPVRPARDGSGQFVISGLFSTPLGRFRVSHRFRHPDFKALALENARECRFEPAPKDATLPDGFMSTTNFPTYVHVAGKWRMPEMHRMDSHLVWDPKTERLATKEFPRIKKGDLVACATAEDGSEGVLVWSHGFEDPNKKANTEDAFTFMATEVSREKPVNYPAIFDEFL